MKTLIQSVKGTRDFYPEEMAIRTWIYKKIGEVASSYGYQEYEAPILERIDLYAAKSGEELVKEQAFVFPDRGGDLITLRPELTPSLARMVAQKQNELIYPLRWWSYGPFWRYEKPQKGRTREFFQWNIDLMGPTNAEADAELISIAVAFFQKMGLIPEQIQIHVNDRRLMEDILDGLGIEKAQHKTVFHLIDRRDKMQPTEWEAYAVELGIGIEQLKQLKAKFEEPDLWKQSDGLMRVFGVLEALGMRDYIQFNAQIIRGLEYYTGTVFEARDASGKGRAILGGGRYDNLVGDVGGDPLGGVGFAMGDVTLKILLEEYHCIPEEIFGKADVLVTVFEGQEIVQSYRIADELRKSGINVISYPEPVKLQKQLKFADRRDIRIAIIQGPDEAAKGEVMVKDLGTHEQERVKVSEAAPCIRKMLAKA
ncbi:MAG: histidine--tRNA ligase [Anaerolineaceae bacterium]